VTLNKSIPLKYVVKITLFSGTTGRKKNEKIKEKKPCLSETTAQATRRMEKEITCIKSILLQEDLSFVQPVDKLLYNVEPTPFAHGAMGEIFKCQFGDTTCCAKTLFRDPNKILSAALADLKKEIKFLSALHHPFVIRLYGVYFETQDESRPVLLTELCKQTLEERIVEGFHRDKAKHVVLSFPTSLRYGLELAMAIDFLADNGVVHRDLKPANVMISFEDHIKLADFGLCKYLGGRGSVPRRNTGETGTYRYMVNLLLFPPKKKLTQQSGSRGFFPPTGLFLPRRCLLFFAFDLLPFHRVSSVFRV
jgi:serine/threonine protein kinase